MKGGVRTSVTTILEQRNSTTVVILPEQLTINAEQ